MIEPYRLRPVPPRVGLLLEPGNRVLVEGAGELAYSDLPPDVSVFANGELVRDLLARGIGEALAWNNAPVRFRPSRSPHPELWRTRSSDARVLALPFPASANDALLGLEHWRDWLADYGASPLGSLGSSGFSLLKATLRGPLWTGVGDRPPVRFTLGGRQELGPAGRGAFEGRLEHWDLPAAYARTLGSLRYGGWWRKVDVGYPWERAHARGALVFLRARVKVPEGLVFGPLPRRPRRQPRVLSWHELELALADEAPFEYPRGTTLQGCWTWDELRAALDAGAELRAILDVWVHVAEEHSLPFWPWWQAVEHGRRMRGFAGLLAKATGNATWGQFAIRRDGSRDVISYTRRADAVRIRKRPLPVHGSRPGAPDLAEQLTGKVRAELYSFMVAAGESLLSAHTDGAWTRHLGFRPAGWRLDDRAVRLELLGPQELRYWRPGAEEPSYTVSGVPERLAPESFERQWQIATAS